MTLKELSEALRKRFGARCLLPGEGSRIVAGLAVEDVAEGWIKPGEVALASRPVPDEQFLERLREAGSLGLVWRSDDGPRPQVIERARALGLGLFLLPPEVPYRRLTEAFGAQDGLLLHSHGMGRQLLESVEGESSIESLVGRISNLLGRQVVVEDSIGQLLAGAAQNGADDLARRLEEQELRASRSMRVDETRRERRDRYARLPDGFLSVPVERWRVENREFFWTPLGKREPSGYLWIDLESRPLYPEDVVILYWARRFLEIELGKERVRVETEFGVRGDFVDDLVSGHYGSIDLLLQRAMYLGADLSEGGLVMIVDIDDFARYLKRRKLKEPAIQALKKRLADASRLQARELFSNFLLGPRSDNIILFLGPSSDAPEQGQKDLPERALLLAARIQRYVSGLLPDLTVSVGIGRYTDRPAGLPDAYSEAQVALEIGHRINGPSSVSTFEGSGTYKLLFRVLQEDPDDLESFYGETLEPVVAYDSRYGTELVRTLLTYLENDGSTMKTAGELFAHRHTIRYRLDRIGELTGLNVEKSEERERLTLGIKAMQLLGRVPRQPSSFTDA